MQNGVGKSVFGRWLKDFRTGQNREQKPHTPLARTLSANVKSKDRKKKICRTLSANQKDRKKEPKTRQENWGSEIFCTRNYKSFAGEDLNGYLDDPWITGTGYRERSFSNPSPDRFKKRGNSPEINHSALVSYLDEEGLKKIEDEKREENSDDRTRVTGNQDGPIMPASAFEKKASRTNHYENHESLLLNEKNKGQKGEKQIEYPRYKGEDRFGYYSEHRYENLETTDYISWSSDRSCREYPEGDDEKVEKCSAGVGGSEGAFRFGCYGDGDWYGGQDEPEAPSRDPSCLKSIRYGPGHEKYPSWPGSVRAETGDKPQRSHSWTEQTNYPKEKVTSYVRPLNKRTNPAFTQQLKTVMERCEKISPETYQKTMEQVEERENRLYLPRVDREGKSIGDQDYLVPSPPERDNPALTQADFEKYYNDSHLTKIDNGDYSTPYEDMRKPPPLTQADLEEYARSYEDVLKPHHQHQGSYAQSEGYHSYVSSSELTTTPFLDRLRRDSNQHWSEEDGRAGRDSVVTTSSGSASSSETLKWHGSMSDVSVASSSCRSRQLIAHSSRVPPAQRHHSESVLYLGNQTGSSHSTGKDRSQQLKLFPVNTYTVQPNEQSSKTVISPTSVPKMSVAERISELERQQQQQQQQAQRFAYFDPDKRHKMSDPTLKAIQKKALLSFYERHQQHTIGLSGAPGFKPPDNWKPDQDGRSIAPPPPPRPANTRRSSCASDVSSRSRTDHSYTCSLVGPVIVGPSISIDDWVPELPPKKPHLRTIPPPLPRRTPSPIQVPDAEPDPKPLQKTLANHDRMPTPDLPPPPPPPEEESLASDEPLPPPPPEVQWHLATAVPRRTTTSSGRASPQSPTGFTPVKDCPDAESSVLEATENIRPVPDAYEIQYDQDAINAILESNRMAELQKKKYSKSKHKDQEEKSFMKSHIENRPPLPLPRDVVTEKKQYGCERGSWQKTKEEVPFVRNFNAENLTRGSVKAPKGESNSRCSLRYPPKKLGTAKDSPEKHPPKNRAELSKPFAVKKVSEYECRIPNRERDGLSVFDTTAIDDASQSGESNKPTKGSNSKASFLALRREKDHGITNCEGSYKLTVSQSGEAIDAPNPEKPSEGLLLDNRFSLEPPDLIPKLTNLNRKSSSAQDVREDRKKCDYNRLNDKYRLITTGQPKRGGLLTESIMHGESPVTTVECVRAVITKLDRSPPPGERLEPRKESYQSREVVVEGPEKDSEGEKAVRVRSNARVNRSESVKSLEGKVERSKCVKVVERSTSFGRTDTMRVVEVSEAAGKAQLSVSDASSQTEEDPEAERDLEEELECERLSRDYASHLSPSDKLQSLLVPDSERKKPTDYVAGLFRWELSSKPRRTPAGGRNSVTPEVIVNGISPKQSVKSEEKCKGSEDSRQLQKKKEELMSRLGKRLVVLKEEREALTKESTVNEELGSSVADSVAKSARPHELAKYRLHVEEVGKITSLLLGLSGRLAKVENALLGLPSHDEERKAQESKRDKLQEQLAEAKQLKENIDRRSESVAKTLGKYLTAEEYADYVNFIRTKAKLIVELREIGEKISFGEEQLAALKES